MVKRLEVFLEFLLFGVVMGIGEDLLAVYLSTGETITWHIVGIVIIVAIPFAAIGELIVDRHEWMNVFHRKKRLKSD